MGIGMFDKYSILHMAFGIVVHFFDVKLINWILLHSVYELTENSAYGTYIINKYFSRWPGGKRYRDCFINVIGDTVSAIVGWFIGYLATTYI